MPRKDQRRAIAVEAARIITHEGQRNYGAAKRKAADRIGIATTRHLPSNHEIEQELRTYQSLFIADHAITLRQLQEVALEVMAQFSDLRPRLVGPVLEGTADQFSSITLHVFRDQPDDMVRLLLDLKVPFTPAQRRIRWYQNTYRTIQLLQLDWRGYACELCLFSTVDLRQSPPSPVDGLPQRRASRQQLMAMLREPLNNSARADARFGR